MGWPQTAARWRGTKWGGRCGREAGGARCGACAPPGSYQSATLVGSRDRGCSSLTMFSQAQLPADLEGAAWRAARSPSDRLDVRGAKPQA